MLVGGTTSINYSIMKRLASQDINVVLVTDSETVEDCKKTINVEFPNFELRVVQVDLTTNYIDHVIQSSQGLKINLLFFNSSDISLGLFADIDIDEQMSDVQANCASALRISHYFVNRFLQNKDGSELQDRAAIFFVSSPAGFNTSPFALTYGATRAFISQFALSLSAEVKGDGIDVLLVHPSPLMSTTEDSEEQSPIAALSHVLLYSCDDVVRKMFNRIGTMQVTYDHGYWSWGVRFMFKFVDEHAFASLVTWLLPFSNEFKRLTQIRLSTQ